MSERPSITNTFQGDESAHGQALRIARDQFGIQVVTTFEADLMGASDSIQLAHAIENGYVLVTGNIKDFRPLVEEWVSEGNHFPGIVYIKSELLKNAVAIAHGLRDLAHQELTDREFWIP